MCFLRLARSLEGSPASAQTDEVRPARQLTEADCRGKAAVDGRRQSMAAGGQQKGAVHGRGVLVRGAVLGRRQSTEGGGQGLAVSSRRQWLTKKKGRKRRKYCLVPMPASPVATFELESLAGPGVSYKKKKSTRRHFSVEGGLGVCMADVGSRTRLWATGTWSCAAGTGPLLLHNKKARALACATCHKHKEGKGGHYCCHT